MLWKVKIRLLIDKVSNIFKKKRPIPRFPHPLYQLQPKEPPKSIVNRAIAILLPFLRECGVICYADLKWLVTRRKKSDEVWADAVEQMQRNQK